MGCLSKLLGNSDHGLSRCVAVGWIIGVLVESSLCCRWELTEREGVAYEGSEMSRQRRPVGIIVWDPLSVALDSSVQLAGCSQELCLSLCPRCKRCRRARMLTKGSGRTKIVLVVVDEVRVLGFGLGLLLLLLSRRESSIVCIMIGDRRYRSWWRGCASNGRFGLLHRGR